MAKNEIRNGQAEHGIRHIMEEEMRAAGQGVYSAKARAGSPSNKMEPAPSNKAGDLTSMLKADLIATAEAEGVDYESDDNKADLIRKIEKARK